MILNYTDCGKSTKPPIVLLHGMAASLRYWDKFITLLKGRRVIAIDLIGFGQSPKPDNAAYDYDCHINSINDTLRSAGITQPYILAGHSMGALIALRLAANNPSAVSKLALAAMPIYKTPEAAKKAITHSSKLKELAYYGPSSRLLCNLWCRLLRPVSRQLAPKYLKQLTAEAAKDSVLHTWLSYSRSLQNIIEIQDVASDLSSISCATLILYGHTDVPDNLKDLTASLNNTKIEVIIAPGTHQIINEQPAKLASWLVS